MKTYSNGRQWRCGGFTIVEVVVAVALFAMVFGAIVAGLSMTARFSVWSKYSSAANKAAEQRMEEVINATWDTTQIPVVDFCTITNFGSNGADVINLEIPGLGPVVNATRTVFITPMPSQSNQQYKVIQVRVAWRMAGSGTQTLTLQGIRGPDQ